MRISLYNLISSLLFASCATPYVVQVELQNAPEMYMSPSVQSVTIVDNSVGQSAYEGHTISYASKVQRLYQETDSLNHDLLEELTKAFESMGIKTNLIQGTLRNDSNYLSKSMVTKDKLDLIKRESNSDIVLFLDRGLTASTLSLSGIESSDAFHVKYDFAYQTDFRFYDIEKEKDLIALNKRSSIIWEHVDWSVDNILYKFQFQNLREQVVMDKLDQIMKSLFPYITTSDRILFCNTNLNMKDAIRYVKRNNLENASIIWHYLYDTSKKDMEKFYCTLNLAYSYEMNDQLSQARFWLANAQKLSAVATEDNRIYMEKYIAEIEKRMVEGEPVQIDIY